MYNLLFCSRVCMAKWTSLYNRGEKHWHWMGGITEKASGNVLYPGYREWRKGVFKRDSYKCRLCGYQKSGQLVSHHIAPKSLYFNLMLVLNNGITLCKKCHWRVHYGPSLFDSLSWDFD